jgi:hypothetical protein
MIKELDKTFYEIQVKGYLDAGWQEMFDGMSIAWQDNVTTISGELRTRLHCTVYWPACVTTVSF